MTTEEVLGKVRAARLHSGLTYAQGLMSTQDLGNEVCAAWMTRICGLWPRLASSNPPRWATLLEATVGFCQLCIEFSKPISGGLRMAHNSVPAAYSIWSYIERSTRN